ncbi:hypothetical protein FZEAL_22 [Fusarium zealandicum]|uniref:Gamma-glutamylcyclotransferase AIG2-like domain-containing protein n=1 Tax=Fusarium zealandicum TaxID=1053134 RepID=A0A8H4UVL3_9HYPO|nr:hypothetical protein FZEAL_22 [Fusarium zealandicum]
MRWFSGITSLLLPIAAAQTFSNNVIYDPPGNYTDPQVLYARPVQLSDGTLLATWENYSPELPLVWFPIFKSVDGGKNWKEISRVKDQVNGWGMRYQPFLYQLPEAVGDFEAGTVICSGSSIPTDLSQTQIEVYASRDLGYTWEFVSHVAAGGPARPEHGFTPVWEPFLMMYQGELVLYYSDQRDNETHSQKMVHQTTTDLLEWSDVVDDVTFDDYFARPGMPIIAKLPTGDYFFIYEYGGEPSSSSYWYPIYYRIGPDPLGFLDVPGQQLVSSDGTKPTGSPYVVWSSHGGENGTIVVSCGMMPEIFTNQALGHPDHWKKWEVPQPEAYTRAIMILEEDPDLLLIMGAGKLPPGKVNESELNAIDGATIHRWQNLFSYTFLEASEKIKEHRASLCGPVVSDAHWNMLRDRKEPQGITRHQRRQTETPTAEQEKHLRGCTFLVKLEGPLSTVEALAEAANMPCLSTQSIVKATDDINQISSFCKINGNAKIHIQQFVSQSPTTRGFSPIFIRYSRARESLSFDSIYPTLGIDSTLPQHRLESPESAPRYPVWYFAYGTLANGGKVEELTGSLPTYYNAKIRGGVLKTWGTYKALVDDPTGDGVVFGKAFQVDNKEHEESLRVYETESYEAVRCRIHLEQDRIVDGLTFRFIG